MQTLLVFFFCWMAPFSAMRAPSLRSRSSISRSLAASCSTCCIRISHHRRLVTLISCISYLPLAYFFAVHLSSCNCMHHVPVPQGMLVTTHYHSLHSLRLSAPICTFCIALCTESGCQLQWTVILMGAAPPPISRTAYNSCTRCGGSMITSSNTNVFSQGCSVRIKLPDNKAALMGVVL